MADVGDRIEVAMPRSAARLGTVTAISGNLVTVRWDTGGETSLIPGPGVLRVIRRARRGAPAGKSTPTTKQPRPARSPAAKASAKQPRGAAKTSRVAPKKATKTARVAPKKATKTSRVAPKKATKSVTTEKQRSLSKKKAAPAKRATTTKGTAKKSTAGTSARTNARSKKSR